MAEGEPQTKKRKIEIDPFFMSFLTKRDVKEELDLALEVVKMGFWELNLASLHVDECNARASTSFSKASISTTPIKWENDGSEAKGSPLGDIFSTGVDVLENFLGATPKIPEDVWMQNALRKLLKFLDKKDHQPFFERQILEADWSIAVAQHLLSELAVNSTYTVSLRPSAHVEGVPLKCPCSQKDDLVGKVGDTSFGCKKGWHGSTDIIMEEDLPVAVVPSDASRDPSIDQTFDELDTSASDDRSVSSIEIKMGMELTEKDIRQILAETIVFSFLQQKIKKDILENTLIPGIGISSHSLLLTFYDSVNDVLLLCKARKLYRPNSTKFNVLSILALWLTLNYRLFCTGVTENMKKYKADFFKRVDDHLEEYRNKVDKPMHVYHTQADLFPWSVARASQKPEHPQIKYLTLKPDSPQTLQKL